MPQKTKIPATCLSLDLDLVSRTLAKHRAKIAPAAREIGVSRTDLRQLTLARPDLLQGAFDEMELWVALAEAEIIAMLESPDPRRRQRAVDKILSSWAARDHPLAPARR